MVAAAVPVVVGAGEGWDVSVVLVVVVVGAVAGAGVVVVVVVVILGIVAPIRLKIVSQLTK